MNCYDYFIPLIVIIIVIAMFIYFNYKNKNISQEHFMSTVDLTEYGTRIYGDLFIGFTSRAESDNAKNELKAFISQDPQKYKDLDFDGAPDWISTATDLKNNDVIPEVIEIETISNKFY